MVYTRKLLINLANKNGSTLLEVAAALYIVGLIAMAVFGTSTASTLWISSARDETLVSAYANSIMDVFRGNSWQLHQQLKSTDPWVVVDENLEDTILAFTLDDKHLSIEALEGISTTIRASSFDDSVCYDGVDPNGIYTIGTGEYAKAIIFYDNLVEVIITMEWENGSGSYQLSAILGGR